MRLVRTYRYTDVNGRLIYEVVRFKPKTFRVRRPDAEGGYQWSLEGIEPVLYNLPEVRKAQRVFITEGEKDADALNKLGLVATCNLGGAGKWRERYSMDLAGKSVVVLQDNDEPGRKHALAVATSVAEHAAEVRLLPPFKDAKDVSNWLKNGGTRKRLKEIVAKTPVFAPNSEAQRTKEILDWRHEIRGGLVLRIVESFFLDYVVVPKGLALVLAAWVIGTYVFEIFEFFPYLNVTSPTKRCGKSQVGLILKLLSARSRLSVSLTEAALFRLIERDRPTLIIDEAESLAHPSSERSQNLRTVLQAGFQQGAIVSRCAGKSHDLRDFPVYCPKAILAIGTLPDTIRDRSIVVSMRRKRADDPMLQFRERQLRDVVDGTIDTIRNWAEKHRNKLEERYRHTQLDFMRDREADIWEPIFTIVATASPERLGELKDTALRLSHDKNALDIDESLNLRLLADIKAILDRRKRSAIATAGLLQELSALPENPWEQCTALSLARLLRPFGISPKQLWIDEDNVRGYAAEDLKPAFDRYLGTQP